MYVNIFTARMNIHVEPRIILFMFANSYAPEGVFTSLNFSKARQLKKTESEAFWKEVIAGGYLENPRRCLIHAFQSTILVGRDTPLITPMASQVAIVTTATTTLRLAAPLWMGLICAGLRPTITIPTAMVLTWHPTG